MKYDKGLAKYSDTSAGGVGRSSSGKRNIGVSGDPGAPGLWMRVRRDVRDFVGSEAFANWVSGLVFVAEVDGDVLLAAPTALERDRVRNEFLKTINLHWKRIDPRNRTVRVEARDDIDLHILSMAVENADDFGDPAPVAPTPRSSSGGGGDFTGEDASGQSFDALVVGDSNKLAAGLAMRLAAGEAGPVPIVLFYGPNGCGKTHMLTAIRSARRDDKGVVHMSAEEFMLAFVDGVKRKDTSGLRKKVRKAHTLLLDDIHSLKPGTLREFFSHLRAITEKGGGVVVTSDSAPARLDHLDARMRDEIQGGVVVEIHRPDLDMRADIVRAKAELIAKDFPDFILQDEWVMMLADQLPASGRALYGAVRNIFASTVLLDRPVTKAAVEAAIRLQIGRRSRPKVETIKDVVATHFGITKADLESPDRRRVVSFPRQIAMFLGRRLTTCSYPQIGRMFGDRDHTTVIYAFDKITGLIAGDRKAADEIAVLEQKCLDDPRNQK
ncbi:MAG: DnaA/Hda family protein [Pseudomonadota bacterium]